MTLPVPGSRSEIQSGVKGLPLRSMKLKEVMVGNPDVGQSGVEGGICPTTF